MNDIEFKKIIDDAKASKPVWFELSQENDRTSLKEIGEIECNIGIEYPEEYRMFISEYGAGVFAFTNVYSPKREGEWSSWVEKEKCSLPKEFIPISDNGCGDYIGFVVNDGKCSEGLYFSDHDENYKLDKEMKYESFYEFVIKSGLNT